MNVGREQGECGDDAPFFRNAEFTRLFDRPGRVVPRTCQSDGIGVCGIGPKKKEAKSGVLKGYLTEPFTKPPVSATVAEAPCSAEWPKAKSAVMKNQDFAPRLTSVLTVPLAIANVSDVQTTLVGEQSDPKNSVGPP